MSAGPALPTGTVTLLFSDIEGSTALLDRLGPAYRDVLKLHRTLIRRAVTEHGGHELGTEGDSFFVVFPSAADGVRAAVAAQCALATADWPGGASLQVRMGLHTGEPVRDDEGYVGMDVHRAARVAGSAHGGQVLLTEATWALARSAVAPAIRTRDLGFHRFRGIPEPEHLHQLVADGMPDRATPVRSIGSLSGLPDFPGDLVGREEAVEEVTGWLADGARLVTLVGPGGVGKTRLATEVARRRAGSLAEGVHFLALSGARTSDDLWAALAEALGAEPAERDPDALLRALAVCRLLVVLDNLEQLHDAAAAVARLLAAAPGVEVVTTSRTPLRLREERLYDVAPLDQESAVELFLERARRLRPGFGSGEGEAPAVLALTERVDRLPLALELLAGGARMLSAPAMLSRLDAGMALRTRDLDRPERHRSVEQALDWSWRLLPPPLARTMARLGVFVGPFGIPDAAAVAELSEDEAVEHLMELVDASLVRVDEGSAEPAFWVLRTVAGYAVDRLAGLGAGELAAARDRHARRMVEVVRTPWEQLRTTRHIQGRDGLVRQQGNIRAALDHALTPDSSALAAGLELTRMLSWYWYATGGHQEGGRHLERIRRLAATLDDPAVVPALHGLGIMLAQQGRYDDAEAIFRRCLEFYERRGDHDMVGTEANSLAIVLRARGDEEAARPLFSRAVELARATGNPHRLSSALSNLAELEAPHDPGLALRLLEEVLSIDLADGDAWGIGVDRLNMASVHLLAGNVDTAVSQLLEHGPGMLALGDVEVSMELLENLAAAAARRELPEQTAALLGAADALREGLSMPRSVPAEQEVSRFRAMARAAVAPQSWEAAYAGGRSLSPEQAFAAARSALSGSEARR